MLFDSSFKSTYSIQILEEYVMGEKYYYPGAITEGGRDGLIVKVISSEGKNWMGVFSFGEISMKGVSGVYNTANPDKFCIVSRGAGFIVSSNNPGDWEEVKAIPIMDVRPVVHQKLLVFADYTRLTAYDEMGIKWSTERLVYDGFKIIEVTEKSLRCEFWSVRNEKSETFEVDLLTGNLISGITDLT